MDNQKVTMRELLKNRILWRVYLVWFLRRIAPLIVIQALIFLAVIRIFAKSVFVSQVFYNAALMANYGYWALLKYSFFAFFNTRPLTQISILLILGVIALLLRDFIRALYTYKEMWRKR